MLFINEDCGCVDEDSHEMNILYILLDPNELRFSCTEQRIRVGYGFDEEVENSYTVVN